MQSGLYPYILPSKAGAWVGMCCGTGGMTSALEMEGQKTTLAIDKADQAVHAWNMNFGVGAVHGGPPRQTHCQGGREETCHGILNGIPMPMVLRLVLWNHVCRSKGGIAGGMVDACDD